MTQLKFLLMSNNDVCRAACLHREVIEIVTDAQIFTVKSKFSLAKIEL